MRKGCTKEEPGTQKDLAAARRVDGLGIVKPRNEREGKYSQVICSIEAGKVFEDSMNLHPLNDFDNSFVFPSEKVYPHQAGNTH